MQIVEGQPLIVDASLIPSAEFIDDYDARARRWRVAASVTGGLAAVASAVSVPVAFDAAEEGTR